MMSNPLQMVMQMVAQSRNNPGAVVQTIMSQNPQFAQMIRGQNPRQMAESMMRQNGIDPAQFAQMMNMGGQNHR